MARLPSIEMLGYYHVVPTGHVFFLPLAGFLWLTPTLAPSSTASSPPKTAADHRLHQRPPPIIDADLQPRLWSYMGGIARENGIKALAIGGVEDHVHLLLSLPSTMAIAKAMQLIKGGSSKWIHDEFPDRLDFAWQEGYGAFSIGVSQIDDTKRYIANQAEHHRTKSYQEEFLAFLQRHGIEYDPRYLWG